MRTGDGIDLISFAGYNDLDQKFVVLRQDGIMKAKSKKVLKIVAIVLAAGMTQAQLAQRLGVDQRTVSAWEKGVARPSFETLALICDLFDENFDSLLSE